MQQGQKSLYTALCAVQQQLKDWDTDILTDRERTLNCLADLLPGDQRARSRMRMFYESGAADVLVRKGLPADQLCRRAEGLYIRYTDCVDSVAGEVIGAVARAMGMEPGEAPQQTAAPSAMGQVGLPKVSGQLEQLQALAMLRDASSGEKKQRLTERVSELMGELFCLLEDSRFMQEQERLMDRLDEVSGQEREAILARLRQAFRLVGEYGADVNLAANAGLTPREHLERLDPLSRASGELSQLIIRQRTAPEDEKCRLEEQIGRKLDEVMALMEADEEEQPEPKPRRAVPGTIVPAMCSRVCLPRRDMVLKKAVQDQGLWDSWPEARQLLEGEAKTITVETLERLIAVCEKAAQTNADCMQLLAEWYSSGLNMDIGKFHAEGGMLSRDRRKSRYWEEKAAEAGHSIALFNQGLEALMAGDLERAEELGRRSAQSKKGGWYISDGHYLLALVELVRWQQDQDSGNVVIMLGGAKGHYKKAWEELVEVFRMGYESQENRADMRKCVSTLRSKFGGLYGD